jgi:hypothetical protein
MFIDAFMSLSFDFAHLCLKICIQLNGLSLKLNKKLRRREELPICSNKERQPAFGADCMPCKSTAMQLV